MHECGSDPKGPLRCRAQTIMHLHFSMYRGINSRQIFLHGCPPRSSRLELHGCMHPALRAQRRRVDDAEKRPSTSAVPPLVNEDRCHHTFASGTLSITCASFVACPHHPVPFPPLLLCTSRDTLIPSSDVQTFDITTS